MNTFIGKVVEDENGELILVFPDEMINTLDWNEDTALEWINNNDGTFTIKKVEDNVKFGRA